MAKVTIDVLVEQGIDEAFEINPQTAEAKLHKIAQLAKVPPEWLERFTVADLRNLATGIVKNVRVKKPELIAKLREGLEELRQHSLAQANELVQALASVNVSASEVLTLLNSMEPEDVARLLYGSLTVRMQPITIAKTVTPDLRKLLQANNVPVPKQEAFNAAWSALIKDTLVEDKQQYKAGVRERTSNQRIILVEPVIQFANDWLAKLHEWTEGKTDEQIEMQRAVNWQAIVYALAISTGRRPSEIQSTRTQFLALEDGTLQFTGLAKSKTRAGAKLENAREAKECTAPSISPIEHVMNGLRYLELLGKRSDIEHDKVNGKYGKQLCSDLRKDIRQHLADIGILKLYDSRHFYANYWMRLHERTKGRTMDSTRYLESIMGHSDTAVTESYKDIAVWFADDGPLPEQAEEGSADVAQPE